MQRYSSWILGSTPCSQFACNFPVGTLIMSMGGGASTPETSQNSLNFILEVFSDLTSFSCLFLQSRSKMEDPEQLKLKQKAKEMQKAEMEEMRQREANMTALLAIGPRKKLKTENSGNSGAGLGAGSGLTNSFSKLPMRPRVKRVNLKDILFLMEQERDSIHSTLLYKSYLK
ncbi:hypothetical protein V5799_020659 [Amblyomma americanum]|uniref:Transcription initiation factor TFIID component TAF4 C-terminal domain-containing protein n=2 Tax=Amblyomma americanum TaxID=6943 RepID=A0AAQ4ETC6_AMBAM